MQCYQKCSVTGQHATSQWNNFLSLAFIGNFNWKIQPVEFLQTSKEGKWNKSLFLLLRLLTLDGLFRLRSQGKITKVNDEVACFLSWLQTNCFLLFLGLIPRSRRLYSEGRLPFPKSLFSCPWMLYSFVTCGLVHTEVRKLHLVDGYRSTLALAVTWWDGSRWARRGSEREEETSSSIIIINSLSQYYI